jgi:diphthine synthase
VLENAQLYIEDAEKFLDEGKDEVAILSIGYADGLVDALRMAKGLEPTT